MRKKYVVLLILTLALGGCGKSEPKSDDTEVKTVESTESTEDTESSEYAYEYNDTEETALDEWDCKLGELDLSDKYEDSGYSTYEPDIFLNISPDDESTVYAKSGDDRNTEFLYTEFETDQRGDRSTDAIILNEAWINNASVAIESDIVLERDDHNEPSKSLYMVTYSGEDETVMVIKEHRVGAY